MPEDDKSCRGGVRSFAAIRMSSLLPRIGSTGLLLLALTGCPTVDLGEEPPQPGLCRPDIGYYQDVIWPELINAPGQAYNCVSAAGCHERASGRSALRLIVADNPSPSEHSQNYEVVTRFLNCGTPEASSFLTKPLDGVDPHGGGDLISPGSAPEMLFFDWFEN